MKEQLVHALKTKYDADLPDAQSKLRYIPKQSCRVLVNIHNILKKWIS